MYFEKVENGRIVSSCTLRYLDNKQRLNKRNLRLVDIKCSNVTSSSESCHSGYSYLTFRCKEGYRFATNEGILNISKYS